MSIESTLFSAKQNKDGSHTLIVAQSDEPVVALNLLLEELGDRPIVAGSRPDIDENGELEKMIKKTINSVYPKA